MFCLLCDVCHCNPIQCLCLIRAQPLARPRTVRRTGGLQPVRAGTWDLGGFFCIGSFRVYKRLPSGRPDAGITASSVAVSDGVSHVICMCTRLQHFRRCGARDWVVLRDRALAHKQVRWPAHRFSHPTPTCARREMTLHRASPAPFTRSVATWLSFVAVGALLASDGHVGVCAGSARESVGFAAGRAGFTSVCSDAAAVSASLPSALNHCCLPVTHHSLCAVEQPSLALACPVCAVANGSGVPC
jgi:hypothetical protein